MRLRSEPTGTPAEGLAELAEQLVATPEGRSVLFFPAWLSAQGLSDLLDVHAVGGLGRATIAARVFDLLASASNCAYAQRFADAFDVVGLPRRFIDRDILAGDLLVRRGDGDFAHVAVLSAPTLWRAADIAAAGDQPEELAPGWYAYVIEGGARPHGRDDDFARRVLDPDGRVPANQLILRRRWASVADAVEGSLSEDDPAKISPFPDSPFPDLPTDPGGALQQALRDAVQSVSDDQERDATLRDLTDASGHLLKPTDIPLCIVALKPDGSPLAAVGQLETRMYYSGSLIKVAAMYGAFQLRHAVNHLAAALKPSLSLADFWKQVKSHFDHTIRMAVPLLQAAGIQRAPHYETIFAATLDTTSGLYTVDFQGSADPKKNFKGHLREMIVNSHNPSAGFCIQALGYNSIDGALEKGGFFRNGKRNGIWLAGDYLAAHIDPKTTWPDDIETLALGLIGGQVVTIDSVNDGKVKQVATCFDLAKLLVHVVQDDLVSTAFGTPNKDMLALLHDAATGWAPSRMAPSLPQPHFAVTHSKVGVGDLKGGKCPDAGCVSSELCLAELTGCRFVVAFQNIFNAQAHFHLVSEIVERTMKQFISATGGACRP